MKGFTISTDSVTVWVNGPYGLLGRFGRYGIDVHGNEESHCLHCTHTATTAADWPIFVQKMLEHHKISVPDKYKPERFR